MKMMKLFISAAFVFFMAGPVMAERLSVTSAVANIRSGPGTQHEVLWKVEQNHPLRVLEKSRGWIRFRDFEGDEGWVHQSLTGRAATVITTRDKCNVRSGAGTKYEIVFTVGKGVPFRVLKRKAKWLRIRHADGDHGWIHKSLIW